MTDDESEEPDELRCTVCPVNIKESGQLDLHEDISLVDFEGTPCPGCETGRLQTVDGAVENRADSEKSTRGLPRPSPPSKVDVNGSSRSTDAPNDADGVDPAAWLYGTRRKMVTQSEQKANFWGEEPEPLFTAAQIHDLLDRMHQKVMNGEMLDGQPFLNEDEESGYEAAIYDLMQLFDSEGEVADQ